VRILVVGPYPPQRDGIGSYVAAQVARWRDEGHRVRVISPPEGGGDVRVPFLGGGAFRGAARAGRGADRIVLHFQPSLYYRPRAPLSKIATSWALLRLVRRRPTVELLVHEADPPVRWRPDYALVRLAFRDAPVLLFHTDAERAALERDYRVRVRWRVVPHAEGVRVRAPASSAEARRRLGIPSDRTVLVAPGFLHRDKGVDRAIEAVRGVPGVHLYVVGSVRTSRPQDLAYAERLRATVADVPEVDLIERFTADDEFDAWIAAADAVVLPYRRSWSSGVLARAQALDVPAVVTAAGGLAEQASPRDTVVRDDEELRAAIRRIAAPALRGAAE
jgi:glycosyltransferase involved in cell wall biosynthesis